MVGRSGAGRARRSGARRPRAASCLFAALVASLAVPAALAQQSQGLPLGFSWGPGETVEHDSNLLRLSSMGAENVAPDTIFTTDLMGAFHETYSREDVSATATVGRAIYEHFHAYDFTSENIAGTLASNLPYDVNATVKVLRTAQMAHFADLDTALRDVITADAESGSIDFPVHVDWRAVGDANLAQSRNSATLFETQNFDTFGLDGGIRYAPTTGNSVDLVARTARGVYPNGTSSVLISPGYREKAVDLRGDWTFAGASRLQGHAGFVARSNDHLLYLTPEGQIRGLNRDFSGPAFDTTYTWNATAASRLSVFALRQTGAAGDNNYLSAVSRTVRVSPTYLPTTVVEIDAYVEWDKRNYFSNVLQAIELESGLPATGITRVDYGRNAGVVLAWTPRRWLQLSLDAHHERRDSTLSGFSYSNAVVVFNAQTSFQ